VLASKAAWKKYAPEEGDHVQGMMLYNDSVILLRPWLSPSVMRETLFHEVIHACFGMVGFNSLPVTTENNYDMEELVICLLSPQLTQVLKDNPKLLPYVLEN